MDGKTENTQHGRWYKSRTDRVVDGVCGGLSDMLQMDSTLVRILWMITCFIGGIGIIAYIVAMIVLQTNPEQKPLDKQQGKKTNISLLLGAFLMLLGLFTLSHIHPISHWRFPWGFHILPFIGLTSTFWPVLLIGAGVVFLIFSRKGRSAQGTERKQHAGRPVSRSTENKIFGGVCGGFAEHFRIDPNLLRVGFVIAALITNLLAWVLIYIACMMFLPKTGEGNSE